MKIYREVGSLYIVNRKDDEGYERPVYEIEVDEVVECQDCKYYEAGRENEPDYCSRHSEWVRRDFFCGDGVREEAYLTECDKCEFHNKCLTQKSYWKDENGKAHIMTVFECPYEYLCEVEK